MENEKCGCEGLQNNKSKIIMLKDNSGCGCEPESLKESKKVEEKEKNGCGCGCGSESKDD